MSTKTSPRQEAAAPAGPSASRKRTGGTRRGWLRLGAHPALFLFPVPALVIYVIFFALPTVQAFQYAVTDWNGYSADYNNVGLSNFVQIATNDTLFRNALWNNLQFMFAVVIAQTFLALVLALLLAKNSRSSILLRALYFFPTILSSVSVAFIWKFMYDPNFGLINYALDVVGLDALQSAFLGAPSKAIFFVAVVQVWFHAGQVTVIYVAGLQQVPKDLHESATVDGASRWQRFRYVTWPMIAPATAIVIAYTTIQSFKAFDLILGLSGNPPKASLDILSTRIYTTFTDAEFGYAAAQSVFFMIIVGLVTWLQRRAVRLTQQGA